MKKAVLVPALALLCLAPAGAIFAQNPAGSTAPVQKPLSIKFGAFFPTSSSARDAAGSTDFTAGLDYAFTKTDQSDPMLPSVYFDYEGGSKSGGHVNTYGLGLAVRGFASPPSGDNPQAVSPYFGGGIGVYSIDVAPRNAGSSTKTGFGGKVLAGLEFSNAYFIEANYQFLPAHNGVDPSGVGVEVGIRF